MRGINYLAALGTILIFIGIYLFKASGKTVIELKDGEKKIGSNNKLFFISLGVVSILLGLFLIIKGAKLI